jgi:hypothetical protein
MDDRKYGQRGYQESEREPRPQRASGGPPPPREPAPGPRGRGLGAPDTTVFRCGGCGKQQEIGAEVPFAATCAACGVDLHTCVNCVYFDSAVRNECRQGVEPRIAKKRARNECAVFAPKVTQEFRRESQRPAGGNAGNDSRAAFDALFK